MRINEETSILLTLLLLFGMLSLVSVYNETIAIKTIQEGCDKACKANKRQVEDRAAIEIVHAGDNAKSCK